MQNRLWSDIQAQGANLVHVVEHLYTAEREQIESAADFLRNDRPLALIGVASAAYVCMPAEIYLGRHGRYAGVLSASDGLYSLLPALKNANVVINSRSGETAEIVKLGAALREEGIRFTAVTNEPGSRLAGMAEHVVWVNTRRDDLVSINVVTGMMTATLALAAAVMNELDRLRPDFERLAAEMGGVVARAGAQAGAIRDLLVGIRPVYLLYRGQSKGAAYCGRLVLEEVSRTPGVAMEAAEFRQGPNEVIDERFGAVVFAPEGKQGELNLALARDILRSGGRVLLAGAVEEGALGDAPGSQVFPIPPVCDIFRSVLEVAPVQLLAYELAQAQGFSPGEVRYITKVILNEEGIPNQT